MQVGPGLGLRVGCVNIASQLASQLAAKAHLPMRPATLEARILAGTLTRGGVPLQILVHNFAPVASNASEDGRAKNRRVEMVLQ